MVKEEDEPLTLPIYIICPESIFFWSSTSLPRKPTLGLALYLHFSYGQTGSGKTYTMEGRHDQNADFSWDSDPSSGIIPRALHQIFSELSGEVIHFIGILSERIIYALLRTLILLFAFHMLSYTMNRYMTC